MSISDASARPAERSVAGRTQDQRRRALGQQEIEIGAVGEDAQPLRGFELGDHRGRGLEAQEFRLRDGEDDLLRRAGQLHDRGVPDLDPLRGDTERGQRIAAIDPGDHQAGAMGDVETSA